MRRPHVHVFLDLVPALAPRAGAVRKYRSGPFHACTYRRNELEERELDYREFLCLRGGDAALPNRPLPLQLFDQFAVLFAEDSLRIRRRARAHFKTGYHARERVLAVLGNDDAKAYLPRGPEQRLGRRQTLRIEVAGFDVREPAGMIDL